MSTPPTFTFVAEDEAGTDALGAALARALPSGCVVGLSGPLGAGKTRLVQAVAAGYGVDRRDVVSPTFVLVHEYRGTIPIYHVDAYRLRDDDEFLQLGVDENFGPPNLTFIEWHERVERCLPDERLEITISIEPNNARRFEIVARGTGQAPAIAALAAALKE